MACLGVRHAAASAKMTLKKKKKEQFLWSILVRHDALSLSLMLLFTFLNEFNDLEKKKKKLGEIESKQPIIMKNRNSFLFIIIVIFVCLSTRFLTTEKMHLEP